MLLVRTNQKTRATRLAVKHSVAVALCAIVLPRRIDLNCFLPHADTPINDMESVELYKLQCLASMKAFGEIYFVIDMVLALFNNAIGGSDYRLQG
jgi:hypothetical protein